MRAFTCYILGWKVPDVHTLYCTFIRSARKSTITEVIALLSSFRLCIGLSSATDDSFHHVAPCEYSEENNEPCTSKVYIRPKTCELLINGNSDNSTCRSCVEFPAKAKKEAAVKQKILSTPPLLNAPLRYTNPEKVTLALQKERAERKKLECENKLLQAEIDRVRNEIKTSGIKVDAEFESDIQHIMKNNIDNASPFMKMFWKEQKKACEDNKNVSKYYPMIIRFCLSLAAKSPSAYEELRDSKILQLPSKRTLRDYRNAIKPTAGFNKDVINELTIAASKLSGHQRYLTVAFDEMKIKESLVFNKNSNELVGHVDIGDPELNYGTFEDTNQLATHAFTYYIRGISSDLKFSLAYFATNVMSSYQIMSTFWEAVGILELTCNLHVIAAVSDGASSNRKFYNNHRDMAGIRPNNDIVHRTVNIYAPERHIWFFADAQHLLKTVRNSIYNSGVGKARNMWNDGCSIIWAHLWTLVNDELNLGVKGDSKLTFEHVNLNPYPKMNVNLAAQILSKTVSVPLKK